ncbi:hypothetical protein [Zavarzinella formosa]|uniref:hypothetical protein n=1 Tax=Zavarzinella formosa TaxID=360055 RepID=UPI0002DD3E1B|nr:hypothetical protein [Zavarzinella formosa]
MRLSLSLTLFTVILASGCNSGPEDKRSEVTGKVTYNGSPLAEGTITFDSGDGAVPGSAEIRDGAYKIAAKPGKNKVVIRAFKIDPTIKANDPVRPVDNRVNYIPAIYNDKSTLVADVSDSKKSFDFDLSGKEK